MNKIVFILYDTTTASMQMRGIAVSDELKKHNIDSTYITMSDINNVKLDSNTSAVIVKIPSKDIIDHLKKYNVKIIYDIIDKFDWNLLKFDYDVVIASNNDHKIKISNYFNKEIIVIPHLHSVNSYKQPVKIKTIGYIGQPIQFPLTKQMTNFCHNNRLNWFQSKGNNNSTVEEDTLKLDLGVIYIDESINKAGLNYEYVKKYKPATKLTNMFVHGIPSLFTPTSAFMEVIDGHVDLKFLIINSIDDIYNKINILLNDNELYMELSKSVKNVAQKYHISNSLNYYRDLL